MAKNKREKWTGAEVKELIAMWPTASYAEMSAHFKRPVGSIRTIGGIIRKEGVNLARKTTLTNLDIVRSALKK